MDAKEFQFTGSGHTMLAARMWLPAQKPVMVVQVLHGMTEHMGRYEKLAEALTARGIALAGFDLRGHGRNPGDASVASLGEDGWQASLEDLQMFRADLEEAFPGVPLVLLGFSLGSFLVRDYLDRGGEAPAGVILIGTGHQPAVMLSAMMSIVKGQVKKAGCDGTSPLVQKLSFGVYNQKFAPNRTAADWLCSDESELDAYLADPLVRPEISAGLFWDLLHAMKHTGGKDMCCNWKKDLPVLLLSGEADPVGDFGKGARRVHDAMEQTSMTDVWLRLFPEVRHDLLHEEAGGAAEKARAGIVEWLEALLPVKAE